MTDQLTDAEPEEASIEAPPAAPAAPSRWQRWREYRRTRVSKWDRPPDPKDWRYFVGTLGKILIATGILMFGFVAYQLWGTGIETARAQNALENEFEQLVAANQQARAQRGDDPPATGTAVDEPGDAPAATDEPATDGVATGNDGATPPPATGGASAVVPGGGDLSSEAIDQNLPVVPPGDAIAKLVIPKIGVEKYVVQGVTLTHLKDGPGHYPDTPFPGQLGNASIAGHRTTYGAPFFDLDQLEPGDEIIVTNVLGDQYVYAVTGLEVVTAADSWVIATRDPNVAELTLTTCHPKYTARDRLVVHSVLVPERSAQVGEAEFWIYDEADPPLPGDDPTFADSSADVVATPSGSTADEATPDAEPAEAGDPIADDAITDDAVASPADDGVAVSDTVPTVDPDDAQIDAFSEGWFHDRAAFSQIALWGLALTVISLLAYQVSKKTRHDSIGFLVGILPFLFCLYFFFQNVNRLLPPGL